MNDGRVYTFKKIQDRVRMIQLWKNGVSIKAIAGRTGCSVTTVYRWINRWQTEGSIYNKRTPSRPRVAWRPPNGRTAQSVPTDFFDNIKTIFPMALGGRQLKVGADVWNPWVGIEEEADGSVTYSGIAVDFLNTIASVLNFTYTVIKPLDEEWGRDLGNGSFSGMIGMCQRKEVDLALGPFVLSWDRYQAADFSTTIHFDQYGIMMPRPVREADFAGVTKPLSLEIWMSLFIAISISMTIGFLINFFVGHLPKEVVDAGEISVISPSWITKILLSETISPLPKTQGSRVYLVTWMIGGLILQAAYSCVLTSLLAVPKVTIPVDSLEDLLSYGKIPWIIEKGSYLHGTFLRAKSGLFKDANDGGTHVAYFYHVKEEVIAGHFAVLVPLTSMKKFMSDQYSETSTCGFYIAKNHIVSVPFALAFPKGSRLIQHFNIWLNFLKESGEMSRSILGETKNATACLVRPGKETGKSHVPFSVMDLSGMFILFIVGMAIAFVVLILENLIWRYQMAS